ncbi:MAG TPA: acyl-CoA dehydrogenase family protein, partial [Alphaproteobacteria bacterium]|nr:acyl-CoA dehydrogenase family protein [Alphaproteobacteria bacterium]
MADKSFLAWPFFDEAHRRLKARLDAWVGAELAPHEHDEGEAETLVRRLVARLGEAGWLRYVVPASHGGIAKELDVRALCLLRETLAYRSGLADFAFAMQGLGSAPISLFGSEMLKARYLP